MPRWALESTEGYRWRPPPSRTAIGAPSRRGWPPLLALTDDELREAIPDHAFLLLGLDPA